MRRRSAVKLAPALITGLFSLFIATSAPAAPAVIHLQKQGQLSGMVDDGIESFKAIPYAAPPVGSLRWRAPKPAKAWTGVKMATAYGPACSQPGTTFPQSEDCLTLNIWRPVGTDVHSKLPVMLWIHGGGSIGGSGRDPDLDGTELARHGVILITINYRLGRMGYFAHPALTKANKDHGLLGNYGLMDQLAAMRWVQDNIAGFGGDASNVTIFGHSAGGCYVNIWMTSPAAKGLFAKAITEACPGFIESEPLKGDGEKRGVTIAASLGIHGEGKATLAQLRARPAAAFNEKVSLKSMYPFLDGLIVKEDPYRVIAAGGQAKVPWMVGSNSFESSYMPYYGVDLSKPIAAYSADAQAAILATYRSEDADDAKAGVQFLSDVNMGASDRLFAQDASQSGTPTYLYSFRYERTSDRGHVQGVPHGGELAYVFDPKSKAAFLEAAQDRAISETTMSLWTDFAKYGAPTGWPAYAATAPMTMVFSQDGHVAPVRDFHSQRLNFALPYARNAAGRWDP